MSTLGRLWRWLEPSLVYMDPMVAICYVELMSSDEPSSPEPDASVDVRRRGGRAERQARPRRLLPDRS